MVKYTTYIFWKEIIMPSFSGFLSSQPTPDIPTQILINIRQVDELLLEQLSEITHKIHEASMQGKIKTEIAEKRPGFFTSIFSLVSKNQSYSRREATNSVANYVDDFIEAKNYYS